ncbi:hypothetical protein LCGC14_1585410, partial [marine sediment metagenome]
MATKFTAGASYTTYECEVWVRKVGSPGAVSAEIWSNTGTKPNAMRASKSLAAVSVATDTISVFKNFVWTGTPAVTSTTVYHVVLHSAGSDNATNHWEVLCDSDYSGKKSSDGSSWSNLDQSPYFRITAVKTDRPCIFFTYKSATYFVTQPITGGNSELYINGDRGAADSNSGNKQVLNDGSKSWTTDQWAGAKVVITKGPGSDELQNWRTITSNTDKILQCSPNWNVAHTTATEYVILDTHIWTQVVADLGAFVTDVSVAGDSIYFAYGDSAAGLDKYLYYNNGGTWTQSKTDETMLAAKLLKIHHANTGETLYHARNADPQHGVSIGKADVPQFDRALFHDRGELVATGIPWDDKDVTNVTQSHNEGHTQITVDSSFGTGVAAVSNLPSPIDITGAGTIYMQIQVSDPSGVSSNDLQFLFDDVEDLGKTWSPVKVFQEDRNKSLVATKVYHNAGTSTTYTDLTAAYDGSAPNVSSITVVTTDYIYIGCSQKFNEIYFNMTAVNDLAAVMNLKRLAAFLFRFLLLCVRGLGRSD